MSQLLDCFNVLCDSDFEQPGPLFGVGIYCGKPNINMGGKVSDIFRYVTSQLCFEYVVVLFDLVQLLLDVVDILDDPKSTQSQPSTYKDH